MGAYYGVLTYLEASATYEWPFESFESVGVRSFVRRVFSLGPYWLGTSVRNGKIEGKNNENENYRIHAPSQEWL